MSKRFDQIVEIIAWLQIVASSFLISCGIGAFIYFRNSNQTNLLIAVAIIILGLVIGILWANKIRKTKGALWFISQVSATPDIDKFIENKDKKEQSKNQ